MAFFIAKVHLNLRSFHSVKRWRFSITIIHWWWLGWQPATTYYTKLHCKVSPASFILLLLHLFALFDRNRMEKTPFKEWIHKLMRCGCDVHHWHRRCCSRSIFLVSPVVIKVWKYRHFNLYPRLYHERVSEKVNWGERERRKRMLLGKKKKKESKPPSIASGLRRRQKSKESPQKGPGLRIRLFLTYKVLWDTVQYKGLTFRSLLLFFSFLFIWWTKKLAKSSICITHLKEGVPHYEWLNDAIERYTGTSTSTSQACAILWKARGKLVSH